MAHYLVEATPVEERLDELREQLAEGAFLEMQPFGRALTRSLRRARRRSDGAAVWEEEDYCSPPLREEREAVLDRYFEDLEVSPVEEGEGWEAIEDESPLFPGLAPSD